MYIATSKIIKYGCKTDRVTNDPVKLNNISKISNKVIFV